MGSDPLLRHRPEFPILASSTYLISNSLGAMPRAAAAALAEYAETWATRGVRAWTEDAELDRAFAAIDEMRATGAWRRWLDRPAVVT